jgi:signal recognition particle subunit SRP54
MSKLFKGMGGMASGGGMKVQQRLLSQMQGKQRFGR